MSYDVMKLVRKEGDHYQADPGTFFPATVARIQECLAGAVPEEIREPDWEEKKMRDRVYFKFLEEAESFPQESWKLQDENRPAVLAFAESWFKRALALAAGKGVKLHILKDENYRRV